MKKIVMLALSLVSMVLYSQVVIGNSAQPQLSSPSVSLEFTTPGGLVLPYVSESAADSNGASEGTLVMDPITNKVKLKVDTGVDVRTVVSGIAESFSPEEIIGKQVMILLNLAPRKIRGIESQGMLLLTTKPDGKLSFVTPDETVENGIEIG